MSFFGLTASERTSGDNRQQGGITKAGNGACRRVMVEAAHQYRLTPRVNSRYRVLSGRRKKTVVVVTAVARELCGFVWAIACQISAPHKGIKRDSTADSSRIPEGYFIEETDLGRWQALQVKDGQVAGHLAARRRELRLKSRRPARLISLVRASGLRMEMLSLRRGRSMGMKPLSL